MNNALPFPLANSDYWSTHTCTVVTLSNQWSQGRTTLTDGLSDVEVLKGTTEADLIARVHLEDIHGAGL